MKAIEKVTRARSILILDHCFWGMLALKLKLKEADTIAVYEPNTGRTFVQLLPTMATDGDTLYFNSKFVDTLNNQELVGVIAHEIGHCALGHIWRGKTFNQTVANIAGDFVVNEVLMNAGFILPKGALRDQRFDNLSMEEVYHILMKELPPKGKGKGKGGQDGEGGQDGKPSFNDPGGCGGFMPANAESENESEADWKSSVANAAQASKGQGDLPANFRKMIEEIIDPPLPWIILLANFVERTARNDYNWNNPNRRYLDRGFVLPGLISDQLVRVVVANDTSGSTLGVQSYFCNEISAILTMFRTTITVIECDAKVHEPVKDYQTDDLPIEFEIKGGGGTSFVPVFDYIEKEGLTPSCLIYLTDTYGTFPKEEPDYPVLWVSVVPDVQCPFGETIYLNPHTANVGA